MAGFYYRFWVHVRAHMGNRIARRMIDTRLFPRRGFGRLPCVDGPADNGSLECRASGRR
jgi:hypothetical protein